MILMEDLRGLKDLSTWTELDITFHKLNTERKNEKKWKMKRGKKGFWRFDTSKICYLFLVCALGHCLINPQYVNCWWKHCKPSMIHLQCCVTWDVRSILSVVCWLAAGASLLVSSSPLVYLCLSSLHLSASVCLLVSISTSLLSKCQPRY